MSVDPLLWNDPGWSAAERERAYSPSSCIGGNYQPFLRAYTERSAQAAAEALSAGARWETLAYGTGPSQQVLLCRPAAGPDARGTPLVVFFHGGYWQELSAADSRFAAAAVVRAGAAFAAVDYTLAPRASVDRIVDECRTALARLAAEPGIDPARIVVCGSSAGAHLAAMAALAHPVHGALLLSGVYALAPLIGTTINAALGLDPASAAALSPLGGAPLQAAHTVVCWGEHETPAFKAQSRAYAEALLQAGRRCSAFEVAGRNHFDIVFDLSSPTSRLGRAWQAMIGMPLDASPDA